MEADGWDPTLVVAGNTSKRKWICALGHRWPATVSSRTRTKASGCPSCSGSGFDPLTDAWIYLIRNEALGLLKIGISNDPENRVGRHRLTGWEWVDVAGPIDGATAREIEQSFLHYLDSASVPKANTFSESFDGYSEAWREEDLRVTSLAEVRDLIRKQDDGSTA